MKKNIFTITLVILIIANSFAVFATENNLNLEVGRELIEKAENQRINSKEIIDYEVENNSYGESRATPIKEKSVFSKITKLFDTKSTLTYSYNTTCKSGTLFTDRRAISYSRASELIDYIYARCKVYNFDGGLLDEDEDTSTNATYAGVSVKNETSMYFDSAIGNHVFRNSGYVDMVRETSDNW